MTKAPEMLGKPILSFVTEAVPLGFSFCCPICRPVSNSCGSTYHRLALTEYEALSQMKTH